MTDTTKSYVSRIQGRFEFIDALRGVAAFSVLLFHVVGMHKDIVAVPRWASPFVLNGGMGVTLFFIVSAFCLCLTMRKHEREASRSSKFYLRRIFRIVPLFYFLLVFILLRDRAVGGFHSLTDIFHSIFFLFNFVPGKHEGIVWASWTLGVEMVFYLLFPFIYRFANNLRKSLVFLGLTLAISACFTLFVNKLIITASYRDSFLNHSFFHQLPVFALGIVTFFVYEEFILGRNRSHKWAYALAGVAVIGYFGLWIENLHTLASGVVVRALICAVFFLGLAMAPLGIIVNRPSRFIGKISYSFYLIHPVVVYSLKPVYLAVYALDFPASLQYGVCLVLALVPLTILSYLAFRFIEQPGMRIGNSLIKKISSATPSILVVKSTNVSVWSNMLHIVTPAVIVIGLVGLVYYNAEAINLSNRIDLAAKVSESGLKKSETTEATKSDQAQIAVEGFKVTNGTLEKGGLGYILNSDKDKVAVAMMQINPPFNNIMKIKGQMKSALSSGTRNGFISFTGYFSDKKMQGAKAGILIGSKKFTIDGAFVDKVEKSHNFDQGKVIDFELTINLKEKNVSMKIDGQNVTSIMTKAPLFISNIGFLAANTKTEFSDLQISGD